MTRRRRSAWPQRARALLPVVLAGALAACADGSDPGSGTGTLDARIELEGRPGRTTAELSLRAGGNPVAGANVVFTDVELGRKVTAEQKQAGNYRASFEGYVRTVRVRIVSGDDELEAQLLGPAPHVITRPENDVIVRRGAAEVLRVEWSAEDRAERAEVDPEKGETIELEGDPFTADVPLGVLEDGEQDLEVTRETSVELAGGVPGSRMRARYRMDNRFTLEP